MRDDSLGWLWQRGSPLTIPNREVKPVSADGTANRGRVGRRLFLEVLYSNVGDFLFYLTKDFFFYKRIEELIELKSHKLVIPFFNVGFLLVKANCS